MKPTGATTPVTVCIAAHNEEQTIGRVLAYVEALGRELVGEILVCANGCSDRTEEIVEEAGRLHGRTRLLRSPAGKPNAWNALVSEAAFETLVFVDADVEPAPGCLETLVSTLAREEGLIVLGGIVVTRGSPDRPWSRLTAFIERPLGFDFLRGSIYAMRRPRLLRRLREEGYESLPTDILHEDNWLQTLLREGEFGVEQRAVVHEPSGTLADFQRHMVRKRLSWEQIRDQHPALHRRWREEYRSSGNRLRMFWRKTALNAGPGGKLAGLVAFLLRTTVALACRRRLAARYEEMKAEYRRFGGANLLAGQGRRTATKS